MTRAKDIIDHLSIPEDRTSSEQRDLLNVHKEVIASKGNVTTRLGLQVSNALSNYLYALRHGDENKVKAAIAELSRVKVGSN